MPLSRGQRICNAHKRDGSPCGMVAIKGKTKCRMHGGKSLGGAASPLFKAGRYSKFLPARLAERYEAARVHPRLLSLSDDIAAAEARLADLFQRVDTGESGALWQEVRDTLGDLDTAIAERDMTKANTHLTTLRRLVTQGTDDFQMWSEIYRVWDARVKLTNQESKTLLTMQQMLTIQQVSTMLGVITHAISEAVTAHADESTGRKILADISVELQRISDIEAQG